MIQSRRADAARQARRRPGVAETLARFVGTLAIPVAPWLFQSLAGPAAAPAAHGTLEPSAFAGSSGPYTVVFTSPASGTLAAGPASTPPAAAAGSVPTGPAASTCAAALTYLAAHAAPGFVGVCPHDAGGHQASTLCIRLATCVPGTEYIWIADPCPAAYMNEASNSWVLMGVSDAPWDPYGFCGQPGDPLGR